MLDHLVAADALALMGGAITAVLITAGVSKTLDRDQFIDTVSQLGVPVRIAPGVADAVLAAEYGIAALVGLNMYLAGLAGSVLFLAFACISFFAEISGRTVSCTCFGSSSVVMGRGTALRSLLLAGVAALMAGTSGRTAIDSGNISSSILLVATVIAASSWFRKWRRAGLPRGYL